MWSLFPRATITPCRDSLGELPQAHDVPSNPIEFASLTTMSQDAAERPDWLHLSCVNLDSHAMLELYPYPGGRDM